MRLKVVLTEIIWCFGPTISIYISCRERFRGQNAR